MQWDQAFINFMSSTPSKADNGAPLACISRKDRDPAAPFTSRDEENVHAMQLRGPRRMRIFQVEEHLMKAMVARKNNRKMTL